MILSDIVKHCSLSLCTWNCQGALEVEFLVCDKLNSEDHIYSEKVSTSTYVNIVVDFIEILQQHS